MSEATMNFLEILAHSEATKIAQSIPAERTGHCKYCGAVIVLHVFPDGLTVEEQQAMQSSMDHAPGCVYPAAQKYLRTKGKE